MIMKHVSILFAAFALVAASAAAKTETKTVRYELDGTTFESSIVYQKGSKKPLPGILMVPNWMGPTESSLAKAKHVAGDKYVVMMVDMYGIDVRPANGSEAGKAAGAVRSDRSVMRARAQKALEVFRAEGAKLGLDGDSVAAIGFCFGGGCVLELGRTGADLDAIVTFHGDLLSPTLESDAAKTKAKVLVLHGAADPYVPQSDVSTFMDVMSKTEVDWQLVQFSHTVHSFTDPTAASDGARYNAKSAERAFQDMRDLFQEIWK